MNIPKHIVLIPDGNRRWAQSHGLVDSEGHRRAIEKFTPLLKVALDMKIPYISAWGMSRDNVVKRSAREVRALFQLFQKKFESILTDKDIHDNQVRVEVIGEWAKLFPPSLKRAIRNAEAATKKYSRYYLTFLLGYDGKREMTDAFNRAKQDAKKGNMRTKLQNYLWTGELPPVDLVVRTGGEPHWSSGFMMWHTADSEFYFTKKLWPDFGPADLRRAVAVYGTRRRKKGK